MDARREVVKELFIKAMSMRTLGVKFDRNMSGGVQLSGSL